MHVETMKARFRAAGRVMVSVHRGLWGAAPENSLPGIRAASAWDVVEIDVQLDASGDPFLIHDDTLERMTGNPAGSGGVAPGLLRELRLREGMGGKGAAMTGEGLPDLKAAFGALEGDAIFDLDVKHARDVPAVAAHVDRLGEQGRATLKIDVEDDAGIERLKSIEADHDIMVMAKLMLRGDDDLAVMEKIRAADIAMVEVNFATLELLEEVCRIGGEATRVGVFTLDGIHCCGMSDERALAEPGAVWGRLVDAGVSQIMTDRARELSAYLAGR